MAISFLQRPEGRLAYDVTGEGPLVVCAPGMGELRSSFRATVPTLVDAGYRVATLDLRGHGDSDATFGSYDDESLASDILALIDLLGGPAVVIGSSMAAGAAVIARAERPEAIAGLILAGPFVRDGGVNPLLAKLMRVLLMKPWGPAVWRWYHASLFPGRKPADFDEHRARVAASLRRREYWTAFVRTSRGGHAEAERRLPDVQGATLVVMGEADPDWPDPVAEARFVADALGGELLLVPHAGHYPLAQYPEVTDAPVLAALARFTQHA